LAGWKPYAKAPPDDPNVDGVAAVPTWGCAEPEIKFVPESFPDCDAGAVLTKPGGPLIVGVLTSVPSSPFG